MRILLAGEDCATRSNQSLSFGRPQRGPQDRVCRFRRDAYPPEAFLKLQQESPEFFLVAKRQGTIVGCVAASMHGSTAEIVSIAVDSITAGMASVKL